MPLKVCLLPNKTYSLRFLLPLPSQVEIRAASEIDEAMAHAVQSAADQGGSGGDRAGILVGERAGTLSPATAVKRPSRPGRGRARLTKRS